MFSSEIIFMLVLNFGGNSHENKIKKSIGGINSRLGTIREKTGNLENISKELTQRTNT